MALGLRASFVGIDDVLIFGKRTLELLPAKFFIFFVGGSYLRLRRIVIGITIDMICDQLIIGIKPIPILVFSNQINQEIRFSLSIIGIIPGGMP